MPAARHRTVRWRGMLALAVVVILAGGIGQTSAGHTALQRAGLIEKPPSYTSLAFQHLQSLPGQLSSAQTAVPVSFVIHNAGPDAHDYQWSVRLRQGTATRQVATGTVRLASGRDVSITQGVAVFCGQGQVEILVGLTRPAESINARIACPSPRR